MKESMDFLLVGREMATNSATATCIMRTV